uniref:Uncharacterized protein n=1 Tax=Myoviridae sp. ctwwN25 TaxID=2825209 RepID=A0A8S5PQ27_9CAUD|nr:MAG TPA: hypothetical protein [Myoviridae sp. ctwwN25]
MILEKDLKALLRKAKFHLESKEIERENYLPLLFFFLHSQALNQILHIGFINLIQIHGIDSLNEGIHNLHTINDFGYIELAILSKLLREFLILHAALTHGFHHALKDTLLTITNLSNLSTRKNLIRFLNLFSGIGNTINLVLGNLKTIHDSIMILLILLDELVHAISNTLTDSISDLGSIHLIELIKELITSTSINTISGRIINASILNHLLDLGACRSDQVIHLRQSDILGSHARQNAISIFLNEVTNHSTHNASYISLLFQNRINCLRKDIIDRFTKQSSSYRLHERVELSAIGIAIIDTLDNAFILLKSSSLLSLLLSSSFLLSFHAFIKRVDSTFDNQFVRNRLKRHSHLKFLLNRHLLVCLNQLNCDIRSTIRQCIDINEFRNHNTIRNIHSIDMLIAGILTVNRYKLKEDNRVFILIGDISNQIRNVEGLNLINIFNVVLDILFDIFNNI